MANRIFEVPVRIIVANEDAKIPQQMNFTIDELKDSLGDCIVLDIDTENGTASMGDNGENAVAGIQVDWDKIYEV